MFSVVSEPNTSLHSNVLFFLFLYKHLLILLLLNPNPFIISSRGSWLLHCVLHA